MGILSMLVKWFTNADNMQRPFLRRVEDVKRFACKVLYIRVTSDEESSQTTHAFCFKQLVKDHKLSKVFIVWLSNRSEVRNIKFGLKKERKVIFWSNLSSVHFSKATRCIS